VHLCIAMEIYHTEGMPKCVYSMSKPACELPTKDYERRPGPLPSTLHRLRYPRVKKHFIFSSVPISDASGIASHRRTARERAHVLAPLHP
jgi:hypothetical protein